MVGCSFWLDWDMEMLRRFGTACPRKRQEQVLRTHTVGRLVARHNSVASESKGEQTPTYDLAQEV